MIEASVTCKLCLSAGLFCAASYNYLLVKMRVKQYFSVVTTELILPTDKAAAQHHERAVIGRRGGGQTSQTLKGLLFL